MSDGRLSRSLLGVVLSLALVSVAGCGFQPRGQSLAAGHLGEVYVEASGAQLGAELRQFLDDVGVALAATPAAADVVVSISGERYEKRVLAVDANTGKAREYEVQYDVDYSARTRTGRTLFDNQRLSLTRDYVFDADAVIGKSREETALRDEMRRDAVQQILGRLDRALGG